jgi:dephospho-CoA kinase
VSRRRRRRKARWVVGLTGGIGSGKSAALKELARLGCATADADAIVHRALARGGAGTAPVRRAFGRGVIGPGGAADRAALARRVFRDAAARKKLESILHPLVRKELHRRIARANGVLVLDIPLLFEVGWERLVDEVAVIWAPRQVRLRRLAGRMTRGDALRRMRAQIPLDEKRRRAHSVVDNSGRPASLRRQLRALAARWKAMARGR